jgi:hypothetical protein
VVPVEFLTDDQAAAFGRFTGPPSRTELDRYFWLDDADWERIDKRRGDHNRLGFSLQMTTVRYLGCFLPEDPVAVPTPIVDFLAEQLGITDASCIKQYAARPATQWEHAAEIRAEFGYRNFSDPEAGADLRAYLAARAWTRLEPSKALFDAAVRWLRRRRVLLPGVHALVKLVIEIRTAATTRVMMDAADAPAGASAQQAGQQPGGAGLPHDHVGGAALATHPGAAVDRVQAGHVHGQSRVRRGIAGVLGKLLPEPPPPEPLRARDGSTVYRGSRATQQEGRRGGKTITAVNLAAQQRCLPLGGSRHS